MYSSWSFIMFLMTLNLTLVYQFKLTNETSHFIILCIFLVKIMIYFVIENIVAYRHAKFIFTPWLIYGIYLIDSFLAASQSLKIKSQFIPLNQDPNRLEMTRPNFNYFFHSCILIFYVFLLFSKVFKFTWNEFCYQRKFSNNF